METAYQIVFFGETLPGRDAIAARRDLAAMFKLGDERTERVFSGKRVVLKRGLGAERAMQYRQRFEAMGLRVRLEAVPVAVAVQGATVPASDPVRIPRTPVRVDRPPTPGIPRAPGPDAVQCPQCGEVQPHRTLCRACSVDMPRYSVALRDRGRPDASPNREARPAPASAPHPPAGVAGVELSGRLGRRGYLLGGMVVLLVALWGLSLALQLESPWLLGLLVVVIVFLSARLAILRCHDLGWSGWWSVLTFAPYVGQVFGLLLLVLPGRRDGGTHGERAEPAGMRTIAAAAALLLLTGLTVMGQIADSMSRLPAITGVDLPGLAVPRDVANAEAGAYNPDRDRIVMYSLTTCGYCAAKRQEFDRAGIRYTELFVDTDGEAAESLNRKLAATGHAGGGVGTPVVEVNGVLLANNPPMAEIRKHFRRTA